MKEIVERIHDELRSTWRFRWWGMVFATLVVLAGWLLAFKIPETFEATASVFVDTRTSIRPAIQDLALEQDVNAQINYVRQSLLSGAALEEIAVRAGALPASSADTVSRMALLEDIVERVNIGVAMGGADNGGLDFGGAVYTISYKDPDRNLALKVTQTLLSTLIEDTLGAKREGSQDASEFLLEEIRGYEDKLREDENKLAEFMKANIGLLPTDQGGHFNQLQSELDAVRTAEADLAVALSKREELTRQLRGEAVLASSAAPATGGSAGGTDTLSRIKEAQARLDELLLRFTERHPDVVAAGATLAELTRRREEELAALRRGDASMAAVSGITSSPMYQNIQAQLSQVDLEIASLRGRLAQRKEKAAELRQRMDLAPKVAAEYAQLMRNYEFNKSRRTELMANYEKVRLGAQADSAGSIRFRIVQPPTAPYSPSSKRVFVLAGSLLAALVAGAALTYGAHLLWPVVTSTRSLASIADLPVLGVVSAAFPRRLYAQAKAEILHFSMALGALLVIFVAVVLLDRIGFSL